MRISKDRYYLEIAKAVGLRSPCLRRKFGAIIVVGDVIVSTGYNGPVRGGINCDEVGCLKDLVNAPRYAGYEFCPAVHAEENAIINAARAGAKVLGGTLYIVGVDAKTGKVTESVPCQRCKRVIINAGIARVVTMNEKGEIIEYDPKEWIKEDSSWYLEELEKARNLNKK